MNKRVVVSLVIIAALVAVLIIGKSRKTVDIPEIKGWEGEADEILISKGDNRIKLYKKDDRWLIDEEAYPADKGSVSKLEDKIKGIEITDLISEKPHYDRYDLTVEKAIRVTVKKDSVKLRDLLIGKKSSTNRHTYIKFHDRSEIYLVSGGLTDDFDKTVDDLRDKVIFKVANSGVESFQLNCKGRMLTFNKIKEEVKDEDDVKDKGEKDDDKGEKKAKKVEKWICNEYKNIKLNENMINTVLNSFNPLKADSFKEYSRDLLKRAECTVELSAYKKKIILSIFSKDKDKEDMYLCTSSESPYVFTIKEYMAEKYFKTIKDFKKK